MQFSVFRITLLTKGQKSVLRFLDHELRGNLDRIGAGRSYDDVGRLDNSEIPAGLQEAKNIPGMLEFDQGSPARKRIRLSRAPTQSSAPSLLQKLVNKVNAILGSKLSLDLDGLSVTVS